MEIWGKITIKYQLENLCPYTLTESVRRNNHNFTRKGCSLDSVMLTYYLTSEDAFPPRFISTVYPITLSYSAVNFFASVSREETVIV